MFRKDDHPIIRAYIERESTMYMWETPFSRMDFVNRIIDLLLNGEWGEAFDYVHIQSLTNLGLVMSELVLSTEKFKPGTDLYLYLPSSPRGGIGHSIEVR